MSRPAGGAAMTMTRNTRCRRRCWTPYAVADRSPCAAFPGTPNCASGVTSPARTGRPGGPLVHAQEGPHRHRRPSDHAALTPHGSSLPRKISWTGWKKERRGRPGIRPARDRCLGAVVKRSGVVVVVGPTRIGDGAQRPLFLITGCGRGDATNMAGLTGSGRHRTSALPVGPRVACAPRSRNQPRESEESATGVRARVYGRGATPPCLVKAPEAATEMPGSSEPSARLPANHTDGPGRRHR